MICLNFTIRRPCDSASVCRALVRRIADGVQYPDVHCVYEDNKLIVCNHFGLHGTTCSTVKKKLQSVLASFVDCSIKVCILIVQYLEMFGVL